jgi:hypothetical protein
VQGCRLHNSIFILILTNNIVTCRPISRKQVDKTRFCDTDSWNPTGYGTCFLGHDNWKL